SGEETDGADEATAEAQEPILADPQCSGASVWLYDTPDTTGNRICFDQPGTTNLSSYCRTYGWAYNKFTNQWVQVCTSRWAGHVKSYWPGQLSGSLVVPQTGVDQGQFGCSEWFNNWNVQGFTVAGACAQQATQLTLDVPIQ